MVIIEGLDLIDWTNGVETVRLVDDNEIKPSPCQVPIYPRAIYHHAGTILLDNIIVCGGGDDFRDVVISDCNFYNFLDVEWKPMASMISARNGHAMVTVNDIAYVIGGRLNFSTYLDNVEAFDEGSWKSMQRLPKPIAWLCAVAVDDNTIMAIGGYVRP